MSFLNPKPGDGFQLQMPTVHAAPALFPLMEALVAPGQLARNAEAPQQTDIFVREFKRGMMAVGNCPIVFCPQIIMASNALQSSTGQEARGLYGISSAVPDSGAIFIK